MKAAQACESENFGDWHRDPSNWFELRPHVVRDLDAAEVGIVSDGSRYVYRGSPVFHAYSRPKSYLGVRPAVVQDPQSRLVFTAAALRAATLDERTLNEWVYGYRFRDGANSPDEWSRYRQSLTNLGFDSHAATTDITSFFASVNVDRLVDRLKELGLDGWALDVVRRVLGQHSASQDRGGLPQRSLAASLLAHAALADADDVLAAALEEHRISAARRFVDDISFEGGEQDLHQALVELQERVRQAGLELNLQKTSIVTLDAREKEIHDELTDLIEVTRPHDDDYGDLYMILLEDVVGGAEDALLAAPTKVSQRVATRVLKSLEHYRRFDRVEEWMSAAAHLPQVANVLSRHVVEAGRASAVSVSSVNAWFRASVTRSGHLPWVTAQHALALPSSGIEPDTAVILREWLSRSADLQQVAVAVQRLALREPGMTRTRIKNRISEHNSPLVERLLALGLLGAGDTSGAASDLLHAQPTHALTVRALDLQGWKCPSTSADFDPGLD